MGAIQAQDHRAATWAVGLRLRRATEESIEQAISTGTILRTHVLRPTWHFVVPGDIRWLTTLGADRLRRVNAYYFRHHGIDRKPVVRSMMVMERALAGGAHLTRSELVDAVRRARTLSTAQLARPNVTGHLMFAAEIEGLVCSGPRRGQQFTYALLEERVPQAAAMDRADSLGELARRYYTSHGPATMSDFVWWSGLTARDARLGIELARQDLQSLELGDQVYWESASAEPSRAPRADAWLLPNYDEYMVGYADRSVLVNGDRTLLTRASTSWLLTNALVVDGFVVGTWRRSQNRAGVGVELAPFKPLTKAQQGRLDAARARLERFVGGGGGAPRQSRIATG
jgi:hypothetical protein